MDPSIYLDITKSLIRYKCTYDREKIKVDLPEFNEYITEHLQKAIEFKFKAIICLG